MSFTSKFKFTSNFGLVDEEEVSIGISAFNFGNEDEDEKVYTVLNNAGSLELKDLFGNTKTK